MDVSAVGSNAFLNRHSSRQQKNVLRRQHSRRGLHLSLPPPPHTHTQSYTLLRIAVIHQPSQYNGLSKGPILQLKHRHTALPSRARTTSSHLLSSANTRAQQDGDAIGWNCCLFSELEIKMAALSQMTTQKTVTADKTIFTHTEKRGQWPEDECVCVCVCVNCTSLRAQSTSRKPAESLFPTCVTYNAAYSTCRTMSTNHTQQTPNTDVLLYRGWDSELVC